jgi:GT2 family glycosyltransferase
VTPRVTAVVLAYLDEPLLIDCVEAILSSDGVDADVVVVDNGCTTDAVRTIHGWPGVRVLTPGRNTGFSGGCNLGAEVATGEFLALVNGDAIVRPAALRALVEEVGRPGLATASLRLLDEPEVVNSAGNPVHFLGLSWAGGFGEPSDAHLEPQDVASASGAAMVLRRSLWDELGGFFGAFFAYCEDTELSVRVWQRGLRVRYVPEAVVLHRYRFDGNPQKWYLLERNRLVCLLTLYQPRSLLVLAPAMLALEAAVFAVAVKQGWWRHKARGWVWVLRHHQDLGDRRRLVQAVRCRSDRSVADVFTAAFTPGGDVAPRLPAMASLLMVGYWSAARPLLARRTPRFAQPCSRGRDS